MIHQGQVGAESALQTVLKLVMGLNLRTIAPWQHAFGKCPGSADACWFDKRLAPAVYASRCCQPISHQTSKWLHAIFADMLTQFWTIQPFHAVLQSGFGASDQQGERGPFHAHRASHNAASMRTQGYTGLDQACTLLRIIV